MSQTFRNLLHKNKLDDFSAWLLAKGYAVESSPYAYEAIRIYAEGQPPIIVHKRDRGEHLTVHGKGTALVQQWFEEREVAQPWQ